MTVETLSKPASIRPESAKLIAQIKAGDIPLDHNWNKGQSSSPEVTLIPGEPIPGQILATEVSCEGLRDGIHGVKEYPTVKHMLQYVDAAQQLGLRNLTVGIFSGNGNKIDTSIRKLLAQMRDGHPDVVPTVLLQATPEAINWGLECKDIHPGLKALVFMGTGPSRMLVQEWTQDFVLDKLAWAVNEATKNGMEVIGATEHTTQTQPDFLRRIIRTQVENGAKSFCAADTIGTARPVGVYRLITFIKAYLEEIGHPEVIIEWHGHEDLGNGMANAMMAISAGARKIHTVPYGYGERAGNTPLGIVVNLNTILEESGLKGPWDMKKLDLVHKAYLKVVNIPSPSHGLLSENSFHTSLGIHGDAMNKANQLAIDADAIGEHDVAERLRLTRDTVYCAINPKTVGRQHEIGVSHYSGSGNVKLAYSLSHNHDMSQLTEEMIRKVLSTAKSFGRELTPKELESLFQNGH